MAMSRKVPDVGMCVSCDGLQPQEVIENPETGENYPRKRSPWDKDFQDAMLELEKEWYPEQFNKKDGDKK